MADYGNDERVEVLWAIKAMEHAEVYFNVRNYFEYQINNHTLQNNESYFITDSVLSRS